MIDNVQKLSINAIQHIPWEKWLVQVADNSPSKDNCQRPGIHAASLICLIYTLMSRCIGTELYLSPMDWDQITFIRLASSMSQSYHTWLVTCLQYLDINNMKMWLISWKIKYFSKAIITKNENFLQFGL